MPLRSAAPKCWNGVPVDERPFSRFLIPPQASLNPGGSSEDTEQARGPILGQVSRFDDDHHLNRLSSEEDQVMAKAKAESPAPGQVVPILVTDQTFALYTTHPALVRYVPLPADSSSDSFEGILRPQVRRARQEFHVAQARARDIERAGRAQASSRLASLQNRYPQGVLGVDSPLNDSRHSVYRDQFETNQKTKASRARFQSQRTQYLVQKSSCITSDDQEHSSNLPFRRSTTAGGIPRSVHDSFERLNFDRTSSSCRPMTVSGSGGGDRRTLAREFDRRRAQHLRNHEQAGRPYNIVNGSAITYVPPTVPEKHVPRQAHPSLSIHGYMKR